MLHHTVYDRSRAMMVPWYSLTDTQSVQGSYQQHTVGKQQMHSASTWLDKAVTVTAHGHHCCLDAA